jgi:hypothetical protein
MSGRSITSLMSLNRQLTSGNPLVRQFRLPRLSPFPKLSGDARTAAPAAAGAGGAARRAPAGTAVAMLCHVGPLPEMTTDLENPTAGYTVGNVRRGDAARSAAGRSAWAHLVARVLGGRTAATRG